MKGSSNDAVSARVPSRIGRFRIWENDVGPSPGVQPPRRPPSQVQLMDPAELTVYADLIQTLGFGEAACLSLAQCRQWLIASDEKKKFRSKTLARLRAGRLLNTPVILTLAISSGFLTVEDADRAKAVLEQHRFIMSFRSFRDVLPR
jgi:hypothetical protein